MEIEASEAIPENKQPKQISDKVIEVSEGTSNELIDRIRYFGKSVSDMSISFNELAKAAWRLELAHFESLYLLSYSKCVLYRLKRKRSFFIVRCYWSKKLGYEIKNLKMKHRAVMYIKSVLK